MKKLLLGIFFYIIATPSFAHEVNLYQSCLKQMTTVEKSEKELICGYIDVEKSTSNNIIIKVAFEGSAPLSEVYLPCVMDLVVQGRVLYPPQISRNVENNIEFFDDETMYRTIDELGCEEPYSKFYD